MQCSWLLLVGVDIGTGHAASQVGVEAIQSLLPRGMGVLSPAGDLDQRLGTQPARSALAISAATDEASMFQHLQVARDHAK